MTNADKREALLAKQGWRAGKFDYLQNFFKDNKHSHQTMQNLLGMRDIPLKYRPIIRLYRRKFAKLRTGKMNKLGMEKMQQEDLGMAMFEEKTLGMAMPMLQEKTLGMKMKSKK